MNETFDSFQSLFMEYGPRLIAAIIAGAIIGFEGELYEKPAGLRTNILITLGSCLFCIISFVVATAAHSAETARIAAQIVTGIGFIGGGVIIHYRYHIQGITTAATIWTNAAIGMTIGYGHIYSGVGIAIIVFLVLVMLRPIDYMIDRSKIIQKFRDADAKRKARRREISLEEAKVVDQIDENEL